MTRTPLLGGCFAALTLLACGDSSGGTTGGKATTSSAAPSASVAATATASATVASDSAAPSTSAASSTVASASSAPSGAASVASAGTPSGASTGEPVVGEKATNGSAFSAYMSAAKSYKAGKPGAVTVVVSAGEGYHVNKEYPYKVKLNAAPAGVSFPSDTIKDVSRSEKTATMTVPFNADAPGSSTISGTCSLSVCTEGNCVIDKVPVSVTVKIE